MSRNTFAAILKSPRHTSELRILSLSGIDDTVMHRSPSGAYPWSFKSQGVLHHQQLPTSKLGLLPQKVIGSDIGKENQNSENGYGSIGPMWSFVLHVILFLASAALVFASFWSVVFRGNWKLGIPALIGSIVVFWRVLFIVFP
jgi:hypothetical protein